MHLYSVSHIFDIGTSTIQAFKLIFINLMINNNKTKRNGS